MRARDIIGEHEGINKEAQRDYSKLFTQLLSSSHIQALTALFGWAPPEEDVTVS